MQAFCEILDATAAMVALLVVAPSVVNAQNAARWSWQEPQAKVLPTGDLEWTPKAFEFKAGVISGSPGKLQATGCNGGRHS